MGGDLGLGLGSDLGWGGDLGWGVIWGGGCQENACI